MANLKVGCAFHKVKHGPLSLHPEATVGVVGNLEIGHQGSQEEMRQVFSKKRLKREGRERTAKLSQPLGVSVSFRKTTEDRALSNCFLGL